MHRVVFKPRARRDLAKLPHPVAERIARAIDVLPTKGQIEPDRAR